MARIAGVDIPREKRTVIALTYIFGVGTTIAEQICMATDVDESIRVKDLTEADVNKLRAYIDQNVTVEGDLRRDVAQDIKRKMEINCLQGIRHRKGLPVRGQRTRTNARTRKGPKRTVAGKKKVTKEWQNRPRSEKVGARNERTSPSELRTSRVRSTTRSCRSPTPRATCSRGPRRATSVSRARVSPRRSPRNSRPRSA